MPDISAVSLYESRTLCTQSDPSSSSDGALELAESSTHGSSKPSTEVEEQLKEIKIGQDETTAVARSKRLVYLVLLACAFAAATVTWFFVRTEERHEFENEVRPFSNTLQLRHVCLPVSHVVLIFSFYSFVTLERVYWRLPS